MIPGGEIVADLRGGRIDATRIVSSASGARMTVDLADQARRGTTAVRLDPTGATHAIADPIVWSGDGGRMRSVPMVLGPAFASMTYRHVRDDAGDSTNDTQLAGNPPQYVDGETRFDELVVASDGSASLVAGVGARFHCFSSSRCAETNDEGRITATIGYHEMHQGFPVQVALARTNRDAQNAMVDVWANACRNPLYHDEDEVPFTDMDEVPAHCASAARARPDAVAVAFDGMRGAVVWRSSRTIQLAFLDATDRVVALPPRQLAAGQVGAPSIAMRDGHAIVVWAQRAANRDPYRLALLDVTREAAPATPTMLDTGTTSAFAPALALRDGRMHLAWCEGDERHGAVRFTASSGDLASATGTATTVSSPSMNARDPEFSQGSGPVWLTWSEYPARAGFDQGQVRVSPVRCR